MWKLKVLSFILRPNFLFIILVVTTSCNNQIAPPDNVATAIIEDKEVKISFKNIQEYANTIDKNESNFNLYVEKKLSINKLKSEYPYWQKAFYYANNDQLTKCRLVSDSTDGNRAEWFYFKKGKLVMARFFGDYINEKGGKDTSEYYFVKGILTKALRGEDSVLSLKDPVIELHALDLETEAEQLYNLFTTKYKNK